MSKTRTLPLIFPSKMRLKSTGSASRSTPSSPRICACTKCSWIYKNTARVKHLRDFLFNINANPPADFPEQNAVKINRLGFAFHPELTEDLRLQKMFLDL
ncbi:MAG: hypothetical protein ACI4JZ_07025 [Oscillospiraceae bacterium]